MPKDSFKKTLVSGLAGYEKSLLQIIFDNIPDQIYLKDTDSRVIGGNKAFLKSKGNKLEDIIGKTDYDFYPKETAQKMFESEQSVLEKGKVVKKRECHIIGDTKTFLESTKAPMYNDQGKVIGIAGISRDITDIVKAENLLKKDKQKAEESNDIKRIFLSTVSHETRTPLNGIIGSSSLLLKTVLDENQMELTNTIRSCGENLLNIVNSILDFANIESGNLLMQKVPFNIRDCLEDAFDNFSKPAHVKNIELAYFVSPEVPLTLVGDPIRIRQIFDNLLSNAVKFTETGEIYAEIRAEGVKSEKRPKFCQISVLFKDTGIGMSEEQINRIFHSFSQGDFSDVRRYGGAGLGLVICKRLIEMLDGKIWVESEAGVGTAFHFTLGLSVSDETLETDLSNTSALSLKRALIVDDNHTNCRVLAMQLNKWDIETVEFMDAREAVTHLQEGHRYDVAFFDYQMPSMNGATLARVVRDIEHVSKMPIILVSSYYEHTLSDPSWNALMSKPIKEKTLKRELLRVFSEEPQEDHQIEKKRIVRKIRIKKSERILVVDDNSVNRRIAQLMLKRLGYLKVVPARDGEEAVVAISESTFDIILMDLQMPRLSGIEATKEIRKIKSSDTRPWIIALTASVLQEQKTEALESGMNAFLTKPLTLEELDVALQFRDN